MEIIINNLKINYEMTGSGPDVLLLHGWGSSLDIWARIVGMLSTKYRCTAVDFPGFGKSDMIEKAYTLDDYTRFVECFINELGIENPHMIGHSHGGRTIIKMCADGMVSPEKIVLFDAAGIKPKRTLSGRFRLISFKTIKWFLTLPLLKTRSKILLEKARKHYGSDDYAAAPPFLRQTLVNLVNEDLTPLLPRVNAQTLLIWGENGKATPMWMGRKMEEKIPNAGLCEIKNAGHFSFADAAGQVDLILRSFFGMGVE